MSPPDTFVLASGSPRRQQLLSELGYRLEVIPSHIDETQRPREPPDTHAARLARSKAAAVAARKPGSVVLAADTVVVVDAESLGKPGDEVEFRKMMGLLSDRAHRVLTAVAVMDSAGITREALVETRVVFRALAEAEIAWYWASREPLDKAGGYALQGLGGAFITGITGSHTNVIGLPLTETIDLLQQARIAPPWSRT